MKYFSFFIILSAITISFGLFVAGCGKEKEEVSFIGFWAMEAGGGGGTWPGPSASGTTMFEFMASGKFNYARSMNVRYVEGECKAKPYSSGNYATQISDTLNYYIDNERLFFQMHETAFDFSKPILIFEFEILSIRNCAYKSGTQMRLKAANESAKNQFGANVFKLMKIV